MWDIHAQLEAAMVDALNVGNWQRAGDENAKRPEPVKRPHLVPPVHIPTAEERAALNARLPAAFQQQGD